MTRYSVDGRHWNDLDTMDSAFLSGGFSGVLAGVFASPDGRKGGKAAFEYFDYVTDKCM